VSKHERGWKIYRTRFLIRAKQITEPLSFLDALGREHHGCTGDYLVESSDGTRRIAPREIFEDIYVAMGPTDENWPTSNRRSLPLSELKHTHAARAGFQA
jgi:hypothetical protein